MSIVESGLRGLTETASDVYDTLIFNDGDDLYNNPAPEPRVAFIIGAVFSAYAILLWVLRFRRISKAIEKSNRSTKLCIRAMISAAIDNDSPQYTVVKLAAQSFLFLGGIQLNYELAFIIMLSWFAFESSLDTLRILLSFVEYEDFAHLVVTSTSMRKQIKKTSTQLTPGNVYEDLSREAYIVIMVFLTQGILISFVVIDIFESSTHSCRDGTGGCPVAGTFGSWCFYVLGIFMASVFLLGPNTSFGQSEQNPAFWMQLLLFAKATGSKVTWNDPTDEQKKTRYLTAGDWRVWIRFLMSFIINGVGFHILVHALPIQVAAQSSLTGVVFRAVGMLYLVDLDDTPGYTLTFTDHDEEQEAHVVKAQETADAENSEDIDETTEEAVEKVIQEAHARIDAIRASGTSKCCLMNLSGGMALAAAGGVAGAEAAEKQKNESSDGNKNEDEPAGGEGVERQG